MTSLRVFREVVECGSFVAAADRLDLSPPMASKHLARLERSLGARLLHRSSRHLSLTEAGQLYYDQCRVALDMLDAAEASVGQGSGAPRGQLRVSAPVWCANARFAQALAQYRQRYPEVTVDIRLENRKVDLALESFDVALRATHEPSPALIARPLCPIRFFLVASPLYLNRVGVPRVPADIAALGAILPTYVNIEGMELRGPAGKVKVRLNAVLKSDDTTLAWHAVNAAIGIALLPGWLVDDDLASGRLVRVLPDHEALAVTLFAVYTSRKYMAPKLRSFIDFFSEHLS